MRAAAVEAAGIRKFEVSGDVGEFFGHASYIKLNALCLAFSTYGAGVEVIHSEKNAFRQHICLASRGETILGRCRTALSADQTCVIPPDTEYTTYYSRNYRQLVLLVDADAVSRKLECLTGVPAAPVLFDVVSSFQMPKVRSLRRMILFLAGELDDPDSPFSDLALMEFEQAIIVSFLSGHRHNFSSCFDAAPKHASPQQMRLAEAYIEANWDKPLTVEAISEATGVSVRSVFKSFKEARGYSPMEFLKGLRLRHAQEMFWRSDPSTSVTSVAFRCGFHNLGHFARDYRLRFGELPSETLNRARRLAGRPFVDAGKLDALTLAP